MNWSKEINDCTHICIGRHRHKRRHTGHSPCPSAFSQLHTYTLTHQYAARAAPPTDTVSHSHTVTYTQHWKTHAVIHTRPQAHTQTDTTTTPTLACRCSLCHTRAAATAIHVQPLTNITIHPAANMQPCSHSHTHLHTQPHRCIVKAIDTPWLYTCSPAYKARHRAIRAATYAGLLIKLCMNTHQ